MIDDILNQIIELEEKIRNDRSATAFKNIKIWAGADVIIKKDMDEETQKWLDTQNEVISFQKSEPKKRVVITKYDKELSWLFAELRGICSKKIDYATKYDFYGLLAQTAINHLSDSGDNDLKSLLLKVINVAKEYCNETTTAS